MTILQRAHGHHFPEISRLQMAAGGQFSRALVSFATIAHRETRLSTLDVLFYSYETLSPMK